MFSFDKYGIIDLISGVVVVFTESNLIPRSIKLLIGSFLLIRGISKTVDSINLPDLTFLTYGGADFLAATVLVLGTISMPLIGDYSSQYAGILMLKGGWIFIEKIND